MKHNTNRIHFEKIFVLTDLCILMLCFLMLSPVMQKSVFAESTPMKTTDEDDSADEDVFVDSEGIHKAGNSSSSHEQKQRSDAMDEDIFFDDEETDKAGNSSSSNEQKQRSDAMDEDIFFDDEETDKAGNSSSSNEQKQRSDATSGIMSKVLKGSISEEKSPNGFLFQRAKLMDPISGVAVFDSIVPSGWKASCSVNWHNISLDLPGIATLIVTSPNERVVMSYISDQNFVDNVAVPFIPRQDGVDMGSYSTRLRYKSADELCDWICHQLLKASSVKLIEKKPVKKDLLALVNSTARTFAKNVSEKLGSILSTINSRLKVNGQEGTVADHRYEVVGQDGKTYWIEMLCMSIGCEITVVNNNIMGNTGTSRMIQWFCPVILLYTTESESEFNHWKSVFEMFVQNSVLRPEFQMLNRKYANEIQNQYFKMKTRQLMEMNRRNADRIMNDHSSDPSDPPSLDMAEKWSDVILDRNTFQTKDGGTIKASTSLDHVFQNGDKFLGIQGNADPPPGWDNLKLMH